MLRYKYGGDICGNVEMRLDRSVNIKPLSMPAAAPAAGLGALEGAEWALRTQSLIGEGPRFLLEKREALGLTVFPSDADCLFLNSPVPRHEPLQKHGTPVRNCASFTGLNEYFLRIGGLTIREENAAHLGAVKEVLHG